MNSLIEGLNPQQRRAVTHGEGPLLIIAGAGTGKTKVITHRIAHLIFTKQARPEEILAVTFTEKAANEMEERVDILVPYSFSYVEISTFNSFGERVLRNHGLEINRPPDFALLDDVEQAIFFRENLFQFPLHYYRPLSAPTRFIQDIQDAIKKLKQEDIKPQDYIDYAEKSLKKASGDAEEEVALKHLEIARVFHEYEELLQKKGKIDFEDQVVLVVDLFRQRPSILQLFQEKYKYILVDEFQDTNYIQFELLKLLAAKHRNITVVGDDDQSIFRFRGASLSNIYNFRDIYPDHKKVVLNKNYRSTQAILDSAYRLIRQNNPFRLENLEKINKALKATVKSKEKSVRMLSFDTVSHEADKVADEIVERIKQDYRCSDIAILVRRNADADSFLRALNMREIPFRFSGSRGLYSQEEVRILISFIRSLTDFKDSRSLFHLALSEVYGIDSYALTLLSNHAYRKHLSLHDVFKMVHEGSSPVELSPSSQKKVRGLFGDLLDFVRLASTQNAGRLLYAFLEKTGYLKTLVKESHSQAEMKIKNIRIFFDKVRRFSEITDDDSVHSFARHLDLLQQVGDNPATAEAELEEDAVNVLTVHKAKGLEFPIVFMVSLIADRFPGRYIREKIAVPDEILKDKVPKVEDYVQGTYLQEERRLFYVGMTRAKEWLTFTWARDYGLKRLKKVSPFILEALDLPSVPEEFQRASALEEIRRFATSSGSELPVSGETEVKAMIDLSYFQVNDYLTCPLRYKFRHLVKIPVLPNHNLVFGRVLHHTIHSYLMSKISGKSVSEEDLIQEFGSRWVNEGFLSREHEEMRKKAGEKALRLFYRRQESSSILPCFLEKSFKFPFEGIRFSGRWDRIDLREEGAVIVDYKATEVKDQKDADKKTKDSLQMDIYALSFLKTQEDPLFETQLHFLESDIIGHAQKGDKELTKAAERIKETEEGIRSQDFKAKPDWHNCNLCEFKAICPESYAY